ncbi:MAG: metallophosphoesterase [Candidatus Omnitrophota bacterium]
MHAVAFLGILCFLYGYFIEPYWLKTNTYRISTHKLKNTKIRIVHLSDIHCDQKIRNEKRVVELVNMLKPDIIVFTGDTLNTEQALPAFRNMMSGLKASMAKIAVRGNFDVWWWENYKVFDHTGFKVLDNECIQYLKEGEKISFIGIRFDSEERWKYFLKDLGGGYRVLLSHTPNLAQDVSGTDIDLYLCGHTHGGQVALPLYGALMTLAKHGKKYEAGLYRLSQTALYVHRGIGMEAGCAPRVRFFSRPEIAVFDIEPEQ